MIKLLRSKLLWFFIIVIAISGGAWWKFGPKVGGSEEIKLNTVKRGDVVQRVSISGMIVPNRTTQIAAPYDGYVRKLYVKTGDQVKDGDAIVSVSQSPGTTPEEIFPMRAPFAGSVVQVLKTEGEFVPKSASNNGNAIVRIDDLSKLYVEADVPEIDYPKLKLNQTVMIKAGAINDKNYKGRIQSIAKASKYQERWDRSRVEFPIVVPILDSDENLKPGMSVMIDVITNEAKDALMLPHEFIQKDKDKYFVVLESGKRQNIEVGLQNEEAFEVKSGIAEGDKVRQADFLKM